jgi:pimeloyl-ACP methyl ester carboxylesterase
VNRRLPSGRGSGRAPSSSDSRIAFGPARDIGRVQVVTVDTGIGTAVVELADQRGSAPSGRGRFLLIHGASGSARTWDRIVSHPRARHDAAVIAAIDLPGWGASPSTLPAGATLADMRDAVVACLDALDSRTGATEPWHLIGHSMGGLLALEVAASAPDRIDGLTAVSPSASGVIRSLSHPWRTLTGGRHGGGLPALVLLVGGLRPFSRLERFAPGLVRLAIRAGLMRMLVSPLFRHARRIPAETVRQLGFEMRPRSFAAATRSVVGYDIARWTRISAPLTTIEGDRDVFVGEQDAAGVARVLPEATRVVIPDCGHFPHVEHPGAVAELIWRGR